MKPIALTMVAITEQAAAHHGIVRPPRKKPLRDRWRDPNLPPIQSTAAR